MLRTIQGQVHAAYTLQPLTPAMGVSCRGVDAYLRFTSTQSRRALQGSSLSRNRARAQERWERQGSSRRRLQAPGTNSFSEFGAVRGPPLGSPVLGRISRSGITLDQESENVRRAGGLQGHPPSTRECGQIRSGVDPHLARCRRYQGLNTVGCVESLTTSRLRVQICGCVRSLVVFSSHSSFNDCGACRGALA